MENLHLKNLKNQELKQFELYVKNQLNNITEPKQTANNILNHIYNNSNIDISEQTSNYKNNIIYEFRKLLTKKDINKYALTKLLTTHYYAIKNDTINQNTSIKLKKIVTLPRYLEAFYINILELLIEEHILNKTFNKKQKKIIQEKLEQFYNSNTEEMYLPTFYYYIPTYDFQSTHSIFKNSQNNKETISKEQYETILDNIDELRHSINDTLFYNFKKSNLPFHTEEITYNISLRITLTIDILIKYFYEIEK